MDDTSPDWSLLPDNPMQFFKLPSGFDRKDLKRAYNHWLRIYRPDKYPAEFQKLREAYEGLESFLSQGSSAAGRASMIVEPDKHYKKTLQQSRQNRQTDFTSSSQSLLKSKSAEVLYGELQLKSDLSVDDYIALSILSDTAKPEGDNKFVEWLIQGLQKHPNSSELQRMLVAVFTSNQIDSSSIQPMLLRLSSTINRDVFYYLAKPLLDQYLKANPWDNSKRCLMLVKAT